MKQIIIVIFSIVFAYLLGFSAFADGQIEDSWFDDAMFLGDSLTGSLYTETLINGGLGEAQIVFMNGLGVHKIIRDNWKTPYMGKILSYPEIIQASGVNKLFLLLAANDIGQQENVILDSWGSFVEQIRKLCPDIRIYIQSGTPLYSEIGFLTKTNMDAYNELMKEFCKGNDCVYVDITDGLSDENGFLIEEYQRDNIHLTYKGCKIWIDNLKNPENYYDYKQETENE